MIDLKYKLNRLKRMSGAIGLGSALSLEWQITLRRPMIRVHLRDHGAPVYLRGGSSDLSVFEAVFVGDELEAIVPPLAGDIIDAGANAGYTTVFLAHGFPDVRVIAVEPDAANCAMIARNTDHLDNVILEQAGLWSGDGPLVICDPGADPWALQCRPATEAEGHGAITGMTLDTLFQRHGIERCGLLKLDIEGAETEVFGTPGNWLSRTDRILVEVHGKAAMRAILDACPEPVWVYAQAGEKLLLHRRSAPGD